MQQVTFKQVVAQLEDKLKVGVAQHHGTVGDGDAVSIIGQELCTAVSPSVAYSCR